VLPLVLSVLLLAGCASADKNQPAAAASASTNSSTTQTDGMNMNMGGSTVAAELPAKINGVPPPVASKVLATADWEGMEIQARTMTPATFVVFNGTTDSETYVRPTKHTSFHLMVMLNDEHTHEPIPYASVWAEIFNSSGKVVYSASQLPMLSAYMGPHYGNNVTLPGAGHYKLELQIGPPVAARHLEYAGVWRKPHTVIEHFSWDPKS
jgi:outer membrane murein-binding lipoprotein Lpp